MFEIWSLEIIGGFTQDSEILPNTLVDLESVEWDGCDFAMTVFLLMELGCVEQGEETVEISVLFRELHVPQWLNDFCFSLLFKFLRSFICSLASDKATKASVVAVLHFRLGRAGALLKIDENGQ